MTRKELYQALLYKILDEYSGVASNVATFDDIYDYIDNGDVANAVILLKGEPTLITNLKPMLNSMVSNYNAGTANLVINVAGYEFFLFQNHSHEKYRRMIQSSSPELTVFETELLFIDPVSIYETQLWMNIERLLIDENRRNTFFDKLQNGTDETFSVILNRGLLGMPVGINANIEELYAYSLGRMLNNGTHVVVPMELAYTCPHPFSAIFNYDVNVVYKQYYDIYNVLDEWLHATDLLAAFLKMYQILEYIVFRQQFKEIVDRSTLKQSFLQQIKKLGSKEGEKTIFVKILPTIFNGFKATCEAKLNPAGLPIEAEDFIKDYLTKDKVSSYLLHAGQQPDVFDKGIANFIYDMRCSIVHNKEAEFHVTYHNVSTYESIIPLMKEVMKLMGDKIIQLVNNPISPIRYINQSYDLY